ncbi:MAG: DJ-1/PfpI family protein [Defluviitaleaceae bacterium]|nr:DJ-1/PfpI family protein [Defluviitaleaceae bacterium]
MYDEYEAVVFLTDGFEEIEAVSVMDVLRRGGVKVVSVSLTGKHEVMGKHYITIVADKILDQAKDTHGSVLILPGGPGFMKLKQHELLLELLRLHHKDGGRIAAICAAPTVLGELGILTDKTAVCYPTMENQLDAANISEATTVTDENITTSKGPATSIEFALEILRIIKGGTEAAKVADGMLFDYAT